MSQMQPDYLIYLFIHMKQLEIEKLKQENAAFHKAANLWYQYIDSKYSIGWEISKKLAYIAGLVSGLEMGANPDLIRTFFENMPPEKLNQDMETFSQAMQPILADSPVEQNLQRLTDEYYAAIRNFVDKKPNSRAELIEVRKRNSTEKLDEIFAEVREAIKNFATLGRPPNTPASYIPVAKKMIEKISKENLDYTNKEIALILIKKLSNTKEPTKEDIAILKVLNRQKHLKAQGNQVSHWRNY